MKFGAKKQKQLAFQKSISRCLLQDLVHFAKPHYAKQWRMGWHAVNKADASILVGLEIYL